MAWKRVVDIIPSNFLQTSMPSDDGYSIPRGVSADPDKAQKRKPRPGEAGA
jgi:hypothetical protein